MKSFNLIFFVLGALVFNIQFSWANGREVPEPPTFSFDPPKTTKESRLQDVEAFEPYLELNLTYTDKAKAEAQKIVKYLKENAETISELEFLIKLHQAVALGNNAHSEGRFALFPRNFGSLPYRGYWFDGHYHIISVKPGFENLLGARITHIGKMTAEEANAKLKTLSGGTLEFFRAVVGDSIMVTPAVLHYFAVTESPDEVPLRLIFPTGKMETMLLKPSAPGRKDNPSTAAGRILFPGFELEDNPDWVHLSFEERTPLYLEGDQPLEFPFIYKRIGKDQVPFIQFRINSSTKSQSIRDFIVETRAALGSEKFDVIILDMRLNQGGDMIVSSRFLSELPNNLSPDGKIYVLISNRTFSAGMNGVALIKKAAKEKAILMGEPVGDRLRYWSEMNRYSLPNSKMAMTYAVAIHDLANGCEESPACYWWYAENKKIDVGGLDPDIYLPVSFEDYAKGIDPALLKIEELTGLVLSQQKRGHPQLERLSTSVKW